MGENSNINIVCARCALNLHVIANTSQEGKKLYVIRQRWAQNIPFSIGRMQLFGASAGACVDNSGGSLAYPASTLRIEPDAGR